MATGMEKRASNTKRRLGTAFLAVSLVGCLGLALALACLEVSRRKEMDVLTARLEAFALEVAQVRASFETYYNNTEKLLSAAQEKKETPPPQEEDDYYDDQYEYDDDTYEDEYEDEEEEKDKDKDKGATSNKTGTNGTGKAAGPKRRTRRSYGGYRVKMEKGAKTYSHRSPMSVQARIYVEKPAERNNFHEHAYTERYVHEPKFKPEFLRSGFAAHYYGNLTAIEHRRNYGRFEQSRQYREWEPSLWSHSANFHLYNHSVVVKVPGIYYVYAQAYYKDPHDTCGFTIMKNSEHAFHCTVTSLGITSKPNGHHHMKGNTCYTGGLLLLEENDHISLKEAEGSRFVYHERAKTFMGLFRVAEK